MKAGQNENTQVFKIHKDLCKASQFFKSTFNGQYLENKTGRLELTAVDKITVEVLHQWLYTGSIPDVAGFASESNVNIDLWLRVFTIAHQFMINDLQEVSYYCFRKTFHDFHGVAPSLECVRELYESNLPTNLADMLKSYLLLHCAYWIMDESCSYWE
jgi:BTB/POZ domain